MPRNQQRTPEQRKRETERIRWRMANEPEFRARRAATAARARAKAKAKAMRKVADAKLYADPMKRAHKLWKRRMLYAKHEAQRTGNPPKEVASLEEVYQDVLRRIANPPPTPAEKRAMAMAKLEEKEREAYIRQQAEKKARKQAERLQWGVKTDETTSWQPVEFACAKCGFNLTTDGEFIWCGECGYEMKGSAA